MNKNSKENLTPLEYEVKKDESKELRQIFTFATTGESTFPRGLSSSDYFKVQAGLLREVKTVEDAIELLRDDELRNYDSRFPNIYGFPYDMSGEASQSAYRQILRMTRSKDFKQEEMQLILDWQSIWDQAILYYLGSEETYFIPTFWGTRTGMSGTSPDYIGGSLDHAGLQYSVHFKGTGKYTDQLIQALYAERLESVAGLPITDEQRVLRKWNILEYIAESQQSSNRLPLPFWMEQAVIMPELPDPADLLLMYKIITILENELDFVEAIDEQQWRNGLITLQNQVITYFSQAGKEIPDIVVKNYLS